MKSLTLAEKIIKVSHQRNAKVPIGQFDQKSRYRIVAQQSGYRSENQGTGDETVPTIPARLSESDNRSTLIRMVEGQLFIRIPAVFLEQRPIAPLAERSFEIREMLPRETRWIGVSTAQARCAIGLFRSPQSRILTD